jgi:hypothetical protein
MKLNEIKEKVSRQEWVLPPFQREFVWKEERRITAFVESVFRQWPIGSIILWTPDPKDEDLTTRRLRTTSEGKPQYLQECVIDGQQRMTTMLRIMNDEPFFFGGEGEKKEKVMCYDFGLKRFRFIERDSLAPNTLPVGEILQKKHSEIKGQLDPGKLQYDVDDLISDLKKIGDYDVTIQRPPRPILLRDAQELFIRLNTGGKQLRSVDLALAYISIIWENCRDEFRRFTESLKPTGFSLDSDFFVRCLSAVSLRQSLTEKVIGSFHADNISADWQTTVGGIEKTIDFLKGNLNLGSNLFLEAQNALVPIVVLFACKEKAARNRMNLLAYWLLISYINGRFSGQSTQALNKDIDTILDNETEDPVVGLIRNLQEARSMFGVAASDVRGNRFKFTLYVLYKQLRTRDFVTGFGIDSLSANKSNRLDLHHIFADSILKESPFIREKEDIANKTFLTHRSNMELSDSEPTYLAGYSNDLLSAHLIPTDRQLWKLEKYREFLTSRKQLISQELNRYLNELKGDFDLETVQSVSFAERSELDAKERGHLAIRT